MHTLKPMKLVGGVILAASMPAMLAVAAYAQTPTPPTTEAPAAQTAPQSAPPPGSPTAVPEKMAPTAAPNDAINVKPGNAPTTSVPAPTSPTADASQPQLPEVKDVAVGAAVFGSDGEKVGEVKKVQAEANGSVQAIQVETGGFLGFGTKLISVPADKISKGGKNVELAVTSSDFEKMPQVTDSSL